MQGSVGSNRGAGTRSRAGGHADIDEEGDEDARQNNDDDRGGRGQVSARVN
jgi:hypothetical protein